ncbi:MAG: glycosyltransferase family 2 protein [bacterium]
MTPLSVALLAHNEEANLPAALKSVAWADEIVVVDAGSSDATATIAADHGARVIHQPNNSNLNINKNIAIENCTHDWVLVLDADEIIPPALAGEILQEIKNPRHDGYFVPRRNRILGRWVRHGGQYPDLQLRLIRRETARFPERHVHERIQVKGSVGRLSNPMDHSPYPTIAQMMRKGMFYADFEAQVRRTTTRTSPLVFIYQILIRPPFRFIRRYFFKGGFLDGIPGLAMSFFDAFNNVVRWLRLWELQRTRDDGGETSTLHSDS